MVGFGFVLALGSGLAVGPSGRGLRAWRAGAGATNRRANTAPVAVAHDPVDGQALAGLEALDGGLGQGSKAPVEWPRALARPNQLLLERPNPCRAVWLAVAGAG